MPEPLPWVETLPLVDHHCHSVLRDGVDRAGFEALLTEAGAAPAPGTSFFDSRIGFAVRRWCPPVLDLPAHATPERYLDRRAELGAAEVTRRFLGAAGLAALLVDTGWAPQPLLGLAELGPPAYPVVRLESVAEAVLAAGGTVDDVRAGLAEAARSAVAFKTIAAYRVGLDLAPARPTDTEVAAAARSARAGRIADGVLHRFLIWTAVDLGRPVQIHVGYGDRDLDLHRCDPLLLTGLLRAIEPTGVPVMLLHNYPYHRQAGYLAQVFPHVYADVGLATHGVGQRAPALLAEALELAPFGKFLFSTDAYGLPELYHLGTLLFRRALSDLLREGLAEGAWTEDDARRVAGLIGSGNARRAYRLDEGAPHA
jgi:predicted TIM-barrel fold metal-dependent hydrolase